MYIPDLSTQTYDDLEPDGREYRSVGWLGDRVEREGDTEPTVLDILRHLSNLNEIPNLWLGVHACEICADDESGPAGGGALLVDDGAVRYVLPQMIVHYIIAHRYKLPDVVEAAVWRSAALTAAEWEGHDRSLMELTESVRRTDGGQQGGMALQRLRLRSGTFSDGEEAVQRAIAYQAASTAGRREGHAVGVPEGVTEGKLRGKRSALLRLLVCAKIALTKGQRARIQACTDHEILDGWLDGIVGAKDADDIFT
jgi:hypothetical protein